MAEVTILGHVKSRIRSRNLFFGAEKRQLSGWRPCTRIDISTTFVVTVLRYLQLAPDSYGFISLTPFDPSCQNIIDIDIDRQISVQLVPRGSKGDV